MPIYRTLKPLSRGMNESKQIRRNEIINITWLDAEQIAKLETVGAISKLAAPPLPKLPGWKLRAKRLLVVGIGTVEQFLEADPATLAEQIDASVRTVKKWRADLLRWLVIPEESRPCCGGSRR